MTDGQTTPWYRRTYRWGQTNLTEVDLGGSMQITDKGVQGLKAALPNCRIFK